MNLVTLMVGAPWCSVAPDWEENRIVHALTMDAAVHGWDAQHFIAACGVDDIKLFPQPIEDGKKAAVTWPPRVSNLTDGWVRCRACHLKTGRKRPTERFAVMS